MKSMEIFLRDLNDEARARFEELFGTEEENNFDIVPIAIFERDDDDCDGCPEDCPGCAYYGENNCPKNEDFSEKQDCDCPFGGDINDDCADCADAGDYHYENGECVRRKD